MSLHWNVRNIWNQFETTKWAKMLLDIKLTLVSQRFRSGACIYSLIKVPKMHSDQSSLCLRGKYERSVLVSVWECSMASDDNENIALNFQMTSMCTSTTKFYNVHKFCIHFNIFGAKSYNSEPTIRFTSVQVIAQCTNFIGNTWSTHTVHLFHSSNFLFVESQASIWYSRNPIDILTLSIFSFTSTHTQKHTHSIHAKCDIDWKHMQTLCSPSTHTHDSYDVCILHSIDVLIKKIRRKCDEKISEKNDFAMETQNGTLVIQKWEKILILDFQTGKMKAEKNAVKCLIIVDNPRIWIHYSMESFAKYLIAQCYIVC